MACEIGKRLDEELQKRTLEEGVYRRSLKGMRETFPEYLQELRLSKATSDARRSFFDHQATCPSCRIRQHPQASKPAA